MTPTQLRAFACVARLGSVKAAAGELGVSEAAVSMHVGQLRKEFDDPLFTRTSSGLAFTPGGSFEVPVSGTGNLPARFLFGPPARPGSDVGSVFGGRRRDGPAVPKFTSFARPGQSGPPCH